MITFKQKVFAVVKKIPKGSVLTYKEVAMRVGSPKSCQAVGNALHGNYDKTIPCHRVVRTDGYSGGYNRGIAKKLAILKKEGVDMSKIKRK